MTSASRHMEMFQGLDIETDVPMSRFTSFRVGGPADLLARPRSIEDLRALLKAAREAGMPVTVLGGGSNTLVSDRGIRGLVIILTGLKTAPGRIVSEDPSAGQIISALAGERLSTLCRFAADSGLSGLEWAAGIPGTLGGAVMMNAGAHGSSMAEIIHNLEILDLTSQTCRTLASKELRFEYRGLNLDKAIILKAALTLTAGDPEAVTAAFERNLAAKRSSQPVSKASGGCFFKNPSPDNPAGRLIEETGLKGYRLNGAMVSDLHANFIINHDNASCKDILAVKRVVQDRVYQKFGIKLESEVKAIGD